MLDLIVQGRTAEISMELGKIDLDNLAGEVSDADAVAIWWGVLAAQAQAEAQRSELDLDIVLASTARKVRGDAERMKQKITEAGVEELVTLDELVVKARTQRIERDEKAAILKAVRFAVERKSSKLEVLAGQINQEISVRRPPLLPREARETERVERTPVR